MISPHKATDSATSKLAATGATDPEAGKGELNSAATWDDFPNGRFGDFKSPAFGLQSDPWNSSVSGYLGISVSHGIPQNFLVLINVLENRSHIKMGKPTERR